MELVQFKRRFYIGLCLSVCIIICVVIPMSIKNVDYSEYGIAYSNLTCTAAKSVYPEGKYFIGPSASMFLYNRVVVSMDFTEDDQIECLTSDGIQVTLSVTFQYQIIKGELFNIFNEFGQEVTLRDYIGVTARDSIRDTCATKTAQNFYEERGAIELSMTEALTTDMILANAHVDIRLLQLKNVELPIELKTAIEEKQRSEQDIDNALNERAGELINAETQLETAKVEAATLLIMAEAEAEALLTEAEEVATAIKTVFMNRGSVYKTLMEEIGMNATAFVNDYLHAVILENSGDPILAM